MDEFTEKSSITAGAELGEVFTLVGVREGGMLEEVIELHIGAGVFDIDRSALRTALDILERNPE